MKSIGVMTPPIWYFKICPYCNKTLNKIRVIKRQMYRISKCDKCGKVIDERCKLW